MNPNKNKLTNAVNATLPKVTPAYMHQHTDLGPTPVKLKLVMDDQTLKAHVEVRVGSRVKLNAWVGRNVNADQDEAAIRREVELVANQACEYLGRTHGDNLDSRTIAKIALECLDDIFGKARDAMAKMKRGVK